MDGFTHLSFDLNTPSGYTFVEVGCTFYFSREDAPILTSIDEVSVDGGEWISFVKLQALNLRVLATEIVEHIEDKLATDNEIWDQLIEAAAEDWLDREAEYRATRYEDRY